MGHPSLKKKSKRLSCRTRYKIDKRVREHNRKKRREAKKEKKGHKTDVVMAPNLCPFKEKIIEELNEAKVKEKEIFLKNKMKANNEAGESEAIALAKLVEDARTRARGYEPTVEETLKIVAHEKMESSSLAKEFKKVVAAADVILEIVDARDPLGTRCKIVEDAVLQHPGKRLVLVVNKADLVPRENLEAWLTYLRRSWPTVPFKASVQQQAHKLGRRAMIKKSKKRKNLDRLMSISSCVGAEFLMKLLANYRRNKGITTSITVGVVGVPNVGKSSVINSLKRARSCRVGAEPGVTKTLQAVQIAANIKILDSPGVVMENPIVKNNTLLCLKNLVRSDRLTDPVHAAQTILLRATREQMMSLYNVGDYSTPEEFLITFAKRFGLLGKRGIPDTMKAARALVQDWNRGKIRFYTLPPEDNTDSVISAEIVSDHVKEFDISEFQSAESNLLEVLEDATNKKFVTYLPFGNDQMQVDSKSSELNNIVVDTSVSTKKKGKLRWRKKSKVGSNEKENNGMLPKQKKVQKMAAKKKRKEEARKLKRVITVSEVPMECS